MQTAKAPRKLCESKPGLYKKVIGFSKLLIWTRTCIVFGVTSVRDPVNLHVFEADRVPRVISCFRQFVVSSSRVFVGRCFFEFGSRMSDKSAPQTPSRAAGSREDPILGVKVKNFFYVLR